MYMNWCPVYSQCNNYVYNIVLEPGVSDIMQLFPSLLLVVCPPGLPPFCCCCCSEVGLRMISGDVLRGKGGKRKVRDLLRQKEIAGMTGP